MFRISSTIVAMMLLFQSTVSRGASETLTAEPSGDAYNFVTHYRVLINAPASVVWPVLLDFNAWMYEFKQSTVTGVPGTPGHILRLYEGQDYLTQLTAIEPQHMLTIVNLPLSLNGEFGTGVGVITLHESNDRTEVSLTMSRRYSPVGEGFGELRATRESPEFQARTRAMWRDRFLERLKSVAED
ncbi:MAG: SRPBCC family protein, partial [Pseudomonadota bacterium]